MHRLDRGEENIAGKREALSKGCGRPLSLFTPERRLDVYYIAMLYSSSAPLLGRNMGPISALVFLDPDGPT